LLIHNTAVKRWSKSMKKRKCVFSMMNAFLRKFQLTPWVMISRVTFWKLLGGSINKVSQWNRVFCWILVLVCCWTEELGTMKVTSEDMVAERESRSEAASLEAICLVWILLSSREVQLIFPNLPIKNLTDPALVVQNVPTTSEKFGV